VSVRVSVCAHCVFVHSIGLFCVFYVAAVCVLEGFRPGLTRTRSRPGSATGLAVKKVGQTAATVVGTGIVFLKILEYNQYITVDWERVRMACDPHVKHITVRRATPVCKSPSPAIAVQYCTARTFLW